MRGRRFTRRTFYGRLGMDLGALGFAERRGVLEWNCISQAPGLLEVLGTGARISV